MWQTADQPHFLRAAEIARERALGVQGRTMTFFSTVLI